MRGEDRSEVAATERSVAPPRAPHARAQEAAAFTTLEREQLVAELVALGSHGRHDGLVGRVRQSLARATILTEDQAYEVERMRAFGCSLTRTAKQVGVRTTVIREYLALTDRRWPPKWERSLIHSVIAIIDRERRYEGLRTGEISHRSSTGQLTRVARRDTRRAAMLGDREATEKMLDDRIRRMTKLLEEIRRDRVRNQRGNHDGTTSTDDLDSGH